MKLTLKVWRQKNPTDAGRFVEYQANNIFPDMSFLEMLDVVNDGLMSNGQEPIAFDHDCREGICGSCSLVINGRAHGPTRGTTCQTYMRNFTDGQTLVIEPWRAKAFPVLRDLVCDRSAFDRITQAGGYISSNVGAHPMAMHCPSPRWFPIKQWMQQNASAVAHVSLLARMLPQCYLLLRRFRIWGCYLKASPNALHEFAKWFRKWMMKALAPAPTSTNAKLLVRRKSVRTS